MGDKRTRLYRAGKAEVAENQPLGGFYKCSFGLDCRRNLLSFLLSACKTGYKRRATTLGAFDNHGGERTYLFDFACSDFFTGDFCRETEPCASGESFVEEKVFMANFARDSLGIFNGYLGLFNNVGGAHRSLA